MYCVKKVTQDLTWVGGNDRRLALFEGIYPVPNGVSYNSYLLKDEKNVLFDTADKAVLLQLMENTEHVLGGETLDYIVVHHMEPDHSYALGELLKRYPKAKLVCNKKALDMINAFFDIDLIDRAHIVNEGDALSTGKHELMFINAPMVHWPEVMMTYDKTDGILFSADVFGAFGALNGAVFSDETESFAEYMNEARRYYTNIVGKYGAQVQAVLKKMSAPDINMICPLHGFVIRNHIGDFIEKYSKWSTYTPEENGVMIAYASIYGNTENTAEILAARLREKGIKTVLFDVSVTHFSKIISASFMYSHLVFASVTYNGAVFPVMESLLREIAAHNIQNRTVAFIENGSWAPVSAKLMKTILEPLKNITYLEEKISVKSSIKASQLSDIDMLSEGINSSIGDVRKTENENVDKSAFFKLSYGLFVLTAKTAKKDNGCIINTASQITSAPAVISIAVNKTNETCKMIEKTGIFNISVLTKSAPFEIFKRFGFQSGRDTDKFVDFENTARSENGLLYITKDVNAFFSASVISTIDCGTHTVFLAEIKQSKILSEEESATYEYYHKNIKKSPVGETKKGFVCRVCGYVYEGDTLPEEFVCPICKHGAEDFEPVKHFEEVNAKNE